MRAFITAAIMMLATSITAAPVSAQGVAIDTIPGTAWTAGDWKVFEAKVRWGVGHGLATRPVGAAIAELGSTFVGSTYLPATLEVPGPERLVVNLRALDCVTFVENVLALVRFIRVDGIAALADPAAARRRYESYLTALRYRGGLLDGYPSRLHYFSEWLADNEQRGAVRQVARSLGGIEDREPLSFMTAHRQAYRQLSDAATLAAIGRLEHRLSEGDPRWFIPKADIAARERGIEDGDIIAATSTLAGLDVAHTGFAIRKRGRVYLLHAPLVGKFVEISAVPLADRIKGIAMQDGIMVARPNDPVPAPHP